MRRNFGNRKSRFAAPSPVQPRLSPSILASRSHRGPTNFHARRSLSNLKLWRAHALLDGQLPTLTPPQALLLRRARLQACEADVAPHRDHRPSATSNVSGTLLVACQSLPRGRFTPTQPGSAPAGRPTWHDVTGHCRTRQVDFARRRLGSTNHSARLQSAAAPRRSGAAGALRGGMWQRESA